MFRKTAALSWALVLALAAGAPMSALATEDVSDETVLDTQTEIIDIAEQGTSSGSGASESGNNNSSNNNGVSRASSPVSSTGRTITTTSKTSTPSTGDPTSVIVPAALAAAAVGAFVVAKARRD